MFPLSSKKCFSGSVTLIMKYCVSIWHLQIDSGNILRKSEMLVVKMQVLGGF